MRRLLVLGCSATKRETSGILPAVDRYDGPAYKVLRTFLRKHRWPKDLSVAVLSAKYGLMGSMTPIEAYDTRMSPERAKELAAGVSKTLSGWRDGHSSVQLVLGEDYMQAIEATAKRLWNGRHVEHAKGPIGMKLQYLHRTLHAKAEPAPAERADAPRYPGRPAYFLPDWDDFVDADFDFVKDEFSTKDRADRNELHCSELVRPKRLSDGILVSLAQSFGGKGLLRALQADSVESLAPKQVKDHFGLAADQWAFGDCGAFSYVNEEVPTISVEQAVATYELYGFDLGASVDHIPVPQVVRNGKTVALSKAEQEQRVRITLANASAFMAAWRRRECRFHPVGVVQALSAQGYADMVAEYVGMGYQRVALGGLVPKSDDEIVKIVAAVSKRIKELRTKPWLHLMGVYRPKCQAAFRALGVDSFDSATYFRKAWLRSDQNYLGVDGEWYSAIRVPLSHDPRTAKRLAKSRVPEKRVHGLELAALRALRSFAARRIGVERCLEAVLAYDRLLVREEAKTKPLDAAYRRTLENRPWERCGCGVCREIGIHAIIFRGLNRNKRRGAHNTAILYSSLSGDAWNRHDRLSK